MQSVYYKMFIEQGVDLNYTFSFKDAATGSLLDLTGWYANLIARYYSEDGALAFEATTLNNKLVINNTSLELILTELDTASLIKDSCKYELNIIDTEGNSYRPLYGDICVHKEIKPNR